MLNQKHITPLSLTRLNLKNMRLSYFVPLFVLFLLIPGLAIAYVSYHGYSENAFGLIFFDCQKFIPFFASWWIVFGLSNYVESNISDLIHMHKRSVISDFFCIFSWYLLHVFLLFLLLSVVFDNYWRDFLLIAIQSAVFASAAFFLLFVSNNVMCPFLVVLLYEIFAMLSNFGFMSYINMFSLQRVRNLSDLTLPYVPLLAASLIFVLIGNLFYKRRTG